MSSMSDFDVKDARKTFVGPGFVLADVAPASTPGLKGGKNKVAEENSQIDAQLYELQQKLYANHRSGIKVGNVLLVLQGMDTSGKGGIIKHTVGVLDPQGVKLASFGVPTDEEKAHDFLWRIRKQLPDNGMVGVFDRSHYEDVLIHRVEGWANEQVLTERYEAIRQFEKELVAGGTKIIKVMLHISKQFQKDNLLERLENPAKYWKYNPGDLDTRSKWDAYQEAYQIALTETSTEDAPWYCIPSDNKQYARMAVKYLLLGALEDMNLSWPPADFDVEEQKAKLEAMD